MVQDYGIVKLPFNPSPFDFIQSRRDLVFGDFSHLKNKWIILSFSNLNMKLTLSYKSDINQFFSKIDAYQLKKGATKERGDKLEENSKPNLSHSSCG